MGPPTVTRRGHAGNPDRRLGRSLPGRDPPPQPRPPASLPRLGSVGPPGPGLAAGAPLDLAALGTLALDQPVWLALLLVALPLLVASAVWSRRRLSTGRWVLAVGARLLVLLALVLALAGLTWKRPVSALAVMFVVDASASVGTEGRERALAFIDQALDHQGPGDQAGVVVFGGSAMVEAAPREDLRVARLEATPSPHHSDLAGGIRLASAVLPADRTRRIVVVSDGEETRGDAASQVLLTAGDDLTIATHTLPRQTGPEVLVEDVLVPPRVDEGAPYRVRVVARATAPASGVLRLYRNDTFLGERPIDVSPGAADVLTIPQRADAPGLYRYRAVFVPDDPTADTIPQNNEAMASLQVTGKPRVLVVERTPQNARFLRLALERENLGVDVRTPAQLPPGLSGLRPWGAVILSDVPAYALSTRQQEALEAYVRDLGRGLAMLGGEESFGVGGYYKTPVERALPVDMDLEDKTRFPKLGMVLAIDKSCSMGGGAGSKLGMAKEAGIVTTELLQERDLLGVIGFDHAASWIVRLQPLTSKGRIQQTIASVRPGGGTDIYPALEKGVNALRASDAALKHVILLSDGITAPASFQRLLEGARDEKVTVTTLAFGTDADRATMQDMARWGGGQYYLVTDPRSVPAIFTREALLASRNFLIEEPFRPIDGAPSDLLKGLRAADIPTLHGHVATQPKARAIVPLRIPAEKEGVSPLPLLAHGRYGLGRSLAWTSDATSRWAKGWVGTASYTQLWTQAGRWLAADALASDLQAEAEIVDGELVVTVDAFDEDGAFRNFLDGEARVVAPDMQTRALELRQVGPGRYQGRTAVDQDGAWLVGVALSQSGEVIGKTVAEAVQPWSPEYAVRGGGSARMLELGALGGGGEITDPAAVFARPDTPRMVPRPLWPPLLALAALLLLLDVAARRLQLGGGPLRTERLVAEQAPLPSPTRRAPRRGPAPDLDLEPAEPDTPLPPAPVDPPPDRAAPKPGSYAGRLLAARRRAGTRADEDDEGGA